MKSERSPETRWIAGIALILGATSAHAAGYYNSFFGFKNSTPKLAFTTSAQNLNASLCSSVVTVQTRNGFGAATNVASDLTVNLSGPAGITFYSDSNCTTPITTLTITTGTNSKNFYFLSTTTGSAAIVSTATGFIDATQTETLTTNPYVWTGTGADANWSTAANWSGGAAPGSGNIAVFDGTCASNCSPTMSANVNVSGVRMHTGYAGTITQGSGFTITLGAKGWTQLAGTFTGGNSSISVAGPFSLAGGGFTSTSGTLILTGASWSILNTPVFSANSGTVNFSSDSTLVPGNINYGHVTFGSGCTTFNLSNGTMKVYGTLTMTNTLCGSNTIRLNSGTLMAYGDVISSGNTVGTTGSAVIRLAGNPAGQTLSSSSPAITLPSIVIDAGTNPVTFGATVAIFGNYTFASAGSVNTTGSTLIFNNDATIIPGTIQYNHVSFAGYCPVYNLNNSTMSVYGTLTLSNPNCSSQSMVINSGTLMAHGDVISSGPSVGTSGTAVIQVAGNAAGQTVSSSSSAATFPNLVIDAGASPVTFGSTVALTGNYTMTSAGSLTTTGSTLLFKTGASITPGAFAYNNVSFTNNCHTYNLNNSTWNIGGAFTLTNTCSSSRTTLNSGTLVVGGNVSISGTGGAGTAEFQFVGSNPITVTASAGTLPSGNVTVNLTGGATLNLGSAVSWNGTSQVVHVLSGGINMSGNSLTVKSLSLNGNTVTKSGGTLTVNGAVAGTGSLYGGTVDP